VSKVNWPADLGSDLAALAARVRSLESAGRATQTIVDVGQLSGNIIAGGIDPSAWAPASWSVTEAGIAAPVAATPTGDTYGSAGQQIAWTSGSGAPTAYLERRADGTLILYNGTDPASTIKLSSINAIVTGNLEVVGSLLVDNALYAATPAFRYEMRTAWPAYVPNASVTAFGIDFQQATGKNPADGTGLTPVTASGVTGVQIGRRGIYRIAISVGFPSNGTGTRAVWLEGAGRRIIEDEKGANGAGPTVCTASADVGLNVGNVIVPWCYQSSGAAMTIGGGTTNSYPGFSVIYVCDATVGTYTPPPAPPAPPTPPPPTHGTYRSTAFGSMAWNPGWGWRMSDDNARQGDGSTWGGGDGQRGYFFHDPAGWVANLAGKTPTGGRIWIYRQPGSGYNSPAPIGIWTHHTPNYGGTDVGVDSYHDPGQSVGWSEGAWINLPVWVCNELKGGGRNGLALAHDGAGSYGIFDGRSVHPLNGAIDIDW
jgi:hypothetical protein